MSVHLYAKEKKKSSKYIILLNKNKIPLKYMLQKEHADLNIYFKTFEFLVQMKLENYITQKSTEHSMELFCHQVTEHTENYARPCTFPTLLAKATVILQCVFTEK